MLHTENISEVSKALCTAQSQFKAAIKDSNNPFFKSKYATIENVLEAIAKPFSDNGLSILQPIHSKDSHWFIQTVILHTSGQYLKSEPMQMILEDTKNPQKFGASVTYFRRFSLTSMLGISQTDDDAVSVSPDPRPEPPRPKNYAPVPPQPEDPEGFLGSVLDASAYTFKFGKYKGQSISSISRDNLENYGKYIIDSAKKSGKGISGVALEAISAIESHLGIKFE